MRHLALLTALLLPATGCLANMPVDDEPVHLEIDWRKDFESARVEAAKTGRPALLVMVAGDITGRC